MYEYLSYTKQRFIYLVCFRWLNEWINQLNTVGLVSVYQQVCAIKVTISQTLYYLLKQMNQLKFPFKYLTDQGTDQCNNRPPGSWAAALESVVHDEVFDYNGSVK